MNLRGILAIRALEERPSRLGHQSTTRMETRGFGPRTGEGRTTIGWAYVAEPSLSQGVTSPPAPVGVRDGLFDDEDPRSGPCPGGNLLGCRRGLLLSRSPWD